MVRIAKNKKSKSELEIAVEAKIKAEKAKTLAEWQELQKEIKELKKSSDSSWEKGQEQDSKDYNNPFYLDYKENQKKLGGLSEVQKEMLYENYFLKHSKGKCAKKTSGGEYWDDKYCGDIRDILGKGYRKCMNGVNEFRLGYEGACDNDIDQNHDKGGISTSSWGFVGNFINKIVREISEPKLFFRDFEGGDNEYHGILYRNLYNGRKQKGIVGGVIKVESESKENNPDYQAGFKAGMKSGGNGVLSQVPENVLDEGEDEGYMTEIDKQLGNETANK